MKNQKGITLIALVITIIVLLILAGVSIAMLTGQNGLLTKADNAKTETTKAEAEEAVKIAVGTILANNYDPTYTGTDKTIDAATIVKLIKADQGLDDTDTKVSVGTADSTVVYGKYTVTFNENGKITNVVETPNS